MSAPEPRLTHVSGRRYVAHLLDSVLFVLAFVVVLLTTVLGRTVGAGGRQASA